MKYYKFIFFIILFFSFACNNKNGKEGGRVLARVHDVYLYDTDIDGIVPPNSNAKDSLMIVKSFINNWIRQQLVVMQAESNLPEDQKDFTKQLETYRNSLITYSYESLLIRQKLDTIVSDEEITKYYEESKNNFQLKNNIVKVDYVKINKNNIYNKNIKRLIQTRDTNLVLLDSLRYYCESYAQDFIIDPDQWIYFDDLLKLVPINTYNQEIYLKNNTFVELEDSPYKYYVNFLDFSIKDELSPLDFEKENIKRMILNRRKGELLNKMHNDIFVEALNSNAIEIF